MHERVEAGSPETPEPAAVAIQRQGAVVERMLALQRSTHHKGEAMKDDDEMWAELAPTAEVQTAQDAADKKQWIYIANAFVTSVKAGFEDDPLLYTKSSYYYMPDEL